MINFEFFQILLSFLNIICLIYNARTVPKHQSSTECSKKLIEQVFKPYYFKIELNLFKRLNSDNIYERLQNLANLENDINKNQLAFYFREKFIFYLQEINNSPLVQIDRINRPSKFELLKLNLQYYRFSIRYFNEMNLHRKKTGLGKRSFIYRIDYKLFTFESYSNIVLFGIFGLIMLVILIVFY